MRLSGENTLSIDRRYRGPRHSGNGGYTAGRLAAFVDGPAEVTLRLPPPLERPLTVAGEDGRALLLDWAAIDCSGAYAVGGSGGGEVVLGRMTADVLRLPEEGERCVVVAWPLGEDGRKLHAGTALLGAGGEPLALARQTWIQPRTG